MATIMLSGNNLTINDAQSVIFDGTPVELTDEAYARVEKSQTFILESIKSGKVIYGVTTGFGSMSTKVIDPADCAKLQVNLIESHAIGFGNPSPPEVVRGMLLFRINCIARGNSGVSKANVKVLIDALNKNVLPEVPEQGSVGASGDLCPLSHLMLGLMGKGRIRDPHFDEFRDASEVLERYGVNKLDLGAKEGLALNNGTQFITSNLFYAFVGARRAFQSGLTAGALTLEMLRGTSRAYDHRIQNVRPHEGQVHVASELRRLLEPTSEIGLKLVKNVQEAYSLRCAPQILGPVYDILQSVEKTLEVEMNSANDNPLIFAEDGEVISGGNFHGQYPALAADQLAIGMSVLCNISERRLERLVNGTINVNKGDVQKHLPSFLVDGPGLNSGLMIAQYSSAAICAENRNLAAPSCVNSIPTCEAVEDVVSMGAYGARKAIQSVKNASRCVAIELYAGGLASFYTKEKTTAVLEGVLKKLKPVRMTEDRYYKPEVDRVLELLENGEFCV